MQNSIQIPHDSLTKIIRSLLLDRFLDQRIEQGYGHVFAYQPVQFDQLLKWNDQARVRYFDVGEISDPIVSEVKKNIISILELFEIDLKKKKRKHQSQVGLTCTISRCSSVLCFLALFFPLVALCFAFAGDE